MTLSQTSQYKHRISSFLIIALALFPILRPAIQSILIILFCATSVWFYFPLARFRGRQKTSQIVFLVVTAYYLWFIVTIFWSDSKGLLLENMQSNLILLFFPIVFIFFPPRVSDDTRKWAQLVFIISMLVYAYLLVTHFITGVSFYQELKLNEDKLSDMGLGTQAKYFIEKGYYYLSGTSIRGYRLAETNPRLFLHHGYLSAYFTLALVFSIDLTIKIKSLLLKFLPLIPAIIFLIVIYYMPSMINKAALPLIGLLLLAIRFRNKVWLFATIFVISGAIGYLLIGDKAASIKLVERDEVTSKEVVLIDFFRYHVYACSHDQLRQHWFIGMGGGDVEPFLNQCVPDVDWPGLSEEKRMMNTHSQFLHFLLSGGIVGLGLFLLLWAFLIPTALLHKNKLLLVVIMLVFANSMFENFISRIWGAFFFMYFTFLYMDVPYVKRVLLNHKQVSEESNFVNPDD